MYREVFLGSMLFSYLNKQSNFLSEYELMKSTIVSVKCKILMDCKCSECYKMQVLLKQRIMKNGVGDRLHSNSFSIYIPVHFVAYNFAHFANILYCVLYTRNEVECSLQPILFFIILFLTSLAVGNALKIVNQPKMF
uniref:Uncharacterized protein n=1 Tax=Strongyloides venezuelensis TaxID=75913 RepID=A0A0K0G4E2_STRVS